MKITKCSSFTFINRVWNKVLNKKTVYESIKWKTANHWLFWTEQKCLKRKWLNKIWTKLCTPHTHPLTPIHQHTQLSTKRALKKNLCCKECESKISYFHVSMMSSMSALLLLIGVLPSGATKSSESFLFGLPHIPSTLSISKTEGIIWRCWIQVLCTLYLTLVPEGREIC